MIVAAVTAMGSSRVVSQFAQERVRQTKHRLERIYGRGLVGLRHEETGKVDHRRFAWARSKPASIITFGDFKFDSDMQSTMLLGFTQGVQYQGLAQSTQGENTSEPGQDKISNCFYATYGIVQDLSTIQNSFNELGTEDNTYNWFDPFIYGPFKFVGDFSVSFEHCELSKYMETISNMASLDWGLIADRVTAIGMDAFMNFGSYQNEVFSLLGWYVPPSLPTCVPEDFTNVNGVLDSDAYANCLAEQEEVQATIDEYNLWKDKCYTLYVKQQADKLLEEQKFAEAEAAAEAEAGGFSLSGLFDFLMPADDGTGNDGTTGTARQTDD